MKVILTKEGLIRIPVTIKTDDGIIGEGIRIIDVNDPEYEKWLDIAVYEDDNKK